MPRSLNPPLPTILIIAGVGILLFAAAIAAGVVYVAHRARQAAEIEANASARRKHAASKGAGNASEGGSPKSSSAGNAQSSNGPAGSSAKPDAPYGWTLENGKLVPAPSPAPMVSAPASSPNAPASATADQSHDWAIQYERTEGGPEADLVVRTGDINNLGFGWPKNYDPFSGKSTFPHPFPWSPKPSSPDGTDPMLLGSAVTVADFNEHPFAGDGYTSSILRPCQGLTDGSACKGRLESMPQPIVLAVGALPPKIDAVLFQIFVDDFFQAPSFHSHFQVSLNGTRIPSFEQVLNALDQTGPIGKLITVNLLPEYFPLLNSGTVKLLIDDPTTHAQDGYAVDFVRLLVNPHKFPYLVSVAITVKDWSKNTPIAGATVTAALQSASTDANGNCELTGLPAGLVVATAVAPGYDANSAAADVVAGQTGHAEIQLHRHEEGTSALEKAIAQTGSAAIYGIHFDTDSPSSGRTARPRSRRCSGSLTIIRDRVGSIVGHTDNQGNSAHNQVLSQNRAASVIAWRQGARRGFESPRSPGFWRDPAVDNATANGRALNRRVEIAPARN